MNDEISITNLSIHPATDSVTFDFLGSDKYNNRNDGGVTGKVDVILNRSHQYISVPD